VIRLGQRALWTWRGNLKPIIDKQLAQMVCNSLAEVEINTIRVIYHQSNLLSSNLLCHEHFHRRLANG
jgi:hypothetical protein